jgi:hypothetical protein
MFADKARSLPESGCSTVIGSGLTAIIRLGSKRLPGTNTSLLRVFVNYDREKFYNIGVNSQAFIFFVNDIATIFTRECVPDKLMSLV